MLNTLMFFFFFSSRRRHTIFKCDWSSDVCSSDLQRIGANCLNADQQGRDHHQGEAQEQLTLEGHARIVAPIPAGCSRAQTMIAASTSPSSSSVRSTVSSSCAIDTKLYAVRLNRSPRAAHPRATSREMFSLAK